MGLFSKLFRDEPKTLTAPKPVRKYNSLGGPKFELEHTLKLLKNFFENDSEWLFKNYGEANSIYESYMDSVYRLQNSNITKQLQLTRPDFEGGERGYMYFVYDEPVLVIHSPFYDKNGWAYYHYGLFPEVINNNTYKCKYTLYYSPDSGHVLIDNIRKIWIDWRTFELWRFH